MQELFSTLNKSQSLKKYQYMSFFYDQLEKALKDKGLNFYKLHFLCEIGTSQFSLWKKGARKPSDAELQKIAAVEQLGLDFETLLAWKWQDMYGLDSMIKVAKHYKDKK